jgi:hypothetical protein
MRNLSIALLAALSLVAFAGCKKKGGDCDSTINAAIDRMIEQQKHEMVNVGGDKLTPEQRKLAEDNANEVAAKLKAAMTKSCKDDKWSADMLKCMDDVKSMQDMERCDAKLTPEQKTNSKKAMGMGDMEKPAGGQAGSAAAAAGGGAAPASGGSGDIPVECLDYKAAVEKLSTCDKVPKEARDAFIAAYDQSKAGWANLSAESKANVAMSCKAGADAVMASAKQTCGW